MYQLSDEEYACSDLLGFETNSSNFGEIVDAIYRKLECSFCEANIGPEIFACCGNTPHLLCETCAGEASECPFCSTSISTSRSDEIKRCLKSLNNIPCKFSSEGCKTILHGDEIPHHLGQCSFRPIKCIMPKCGELIPFKQFFDHLTSVHASRINGIYNSNHHEIEWWINGDPSNPGTYFTETFFWEKNPRTGFLTLF